MNKAKEIRARLDVLEAERLILTIELRNELMKAARELLPEAIRQAKPQSRHGKHPAQHGSPALLRLISRLVMRPHQIERPRS